MSIVSEAKARAAYRSYVHFCHKNQFKPAPFKAFAAKLDQMAAQVVVARMADQTPEDADYIAVAVKSAPVPGIGSVIRLCAQCNEEVWVDTRFVDRADRSKAIICSLCVPEITGKPMEKVIAEQIARLT